MSRNNHGRRKQGRVPRPPGFGPQRLGTAKTLIV